MQFQARDHFVRDGFLDVEDVFEFPSMGFLPEIIPRFNIEQLNRYFYLLPEFPNAAFDKIADFQSIRNLHRLASKALQVHRGLAVDQPKRFDMTEGVDQFARQTISEPCIILRRRE